MRVVGGCGVRGTGKHHLRVRTDTHLMRVGESEGGLSADITFKNKEEGEWAVYVIE